MKKYKPKKDHSKKFKSPVKKGIKWKKWIEKWGMTSLKISLPYLEMEWKPNDSDKNAAWELYIELLTRITTQPLPIDHGNEKTALDSIYSIFDLTRIIIKSYKKNCVEFTKIAIIVLNQIIRPFTAKWHKISTKEGFTDLDTCKNFREELLQLQKQLFIYTKMLADMAGVEDLTNFEDTNSLNK